MMKIFAILAMLGTLLTTLTMLVFCLGMGANASPEEIRALKLWMGGLSLLGAAGIAASIVLLRTGRPGSATGAAFLPTMIMAIILLVALLQ
jgi:hypothetical protein